MLPDNVPADFKEVIIKILDKGPIVSLLRCKDAYLATGFISRGATAGMKI